MDHKHPFDIPVGRVRKGDTLASVASDKLPSAPRIEGTSVRRLVFESEVPAIDGTPTEVVLYSCDDGRVSIPVGKTEKRQPESRL